MFSYCKTANLKIGKNKSVIGSRPVWGVAFRPTCFPIRLLGGAYDKNKYRTGLRPFSYSLLKMKRFILSLVAIVFTSVCFAQDIIVKKDGSTIMAKVLKVSQTEVEYKKFSNQDGPSYVISIADLLAINYKNGETEKFEAPKIEAPVAQPKVEDVPSVMSPTASSRVEEVDYHRIAEEIESRERKGRRIHRAGYGIGLPGVLVWLGTTLGVGIGADLSYGTACGIGLGAAVPFLVPGFIMMVTGGKIKKNAYETVMERHPEYKSVYNNTNTTYYRHMHDKNIYRCGLSYAINF